MSCSHHINDGRGDGGESESEFTGKASLCIVFKYRRPFGPPQRSCGVVRSIMTDSRSVDPGSNPGTSTILPEGVVVLNPSNIGTSTHSHGVTNSFSVEAQSSNDPLANFDFWLSGQLIGHGLDCIHSLNFHVSQMTGNIAGYDSAVHELSWGDWVFSAVWESISIE